MTAKSHSYRLSCWSCQDLSQKIVQSVNEETRMANAQAELLSSANRVCLRELGQMRKVWLGPELHALDLTSRRLLALTCICNCNYNVPRVSTCFTGEMHAKSKSIPSLRFDFFETFLAEGWRNYCHAGIPGTGPQAKTATLCHFRVSSRDCPSIS